jgi:hypothetical protein
MRHRNSNGSSHNSKSISNTTTTNGNGANAGMYRSGYNPSSLEAGKTPTPTSWNIRTMTAYLNLVIKWLV